MTYQDAINVGDPKDVEAVEVGGPRKAFCLNLNKTFGHKTPPRKSPRRKLLYEQWLLQKLTPKTKGAIYPNVSRWKSTQKRKLPK